MRILLAIDHSKYSEASMRTLLAQARPQFDEVHVLHVVDIFTPPIQEMIAYYPGIEHARDAQREPAEELLSKTAGILRAKELQVTTALEWGDPRSMIIDAATKWQAELIVLGSHGRQGLERFLLGSVSGSVLRHAQCSVELVRIPSTKKTAKKLRETRRCKTNKVLLPIEDSKFSEAAAAMVIEQARPLETEIRILHVVEPFPLLVRRETSAYECSIESASRAEAAKAEALVAAIAERLRAKKLTVSTAIEVGNARTKILDIAQAWPANLIVLGSHGRKGLQRFLMGEVAEVVARHARCSVEIVRIPQAAV